MNIQELFADYIKSGLYLRGWSPKTAVIYQRAFASFGAGELTKSNLEGWIISRRQAGMSPCGINIYIRAMNSFSAWLKEEGHAEQIVLKQLKAPPKPVTVFSDDDIRLILAFRPKTFIEFRTWTVIQTLLDTGCRINEILTLKSADVDLENLTIMVLGKGNKLRRVPFSLELRKVLFRYKRMADKQVRGQFFFQVRSGAQIKYRNIYRDILDMCAAVGITKRVHIHLTRHTFACHWMRNKGSIYSLSKILGHSSITTTQTYLRGLGVEDFTEEHSRLSPLSKLA